MNTTTTKKQPVALIIKKVDSEIGVYNDYHVRIAQGGDQISSDEELIKELRFTEPVRKGIITTTRLSATLWKVRSKNTVREW